MRTDNDASALIGELACQQNAARNYIAQDILNCRLPCAKFTSAKRGVVGVSRYISMWRASQSRREFATSHILQRGGINAYLANEKLVSAREERIERINAAIDAGELPKQRDLRSHRRKLLPKRRKDGLTLELVVPAKRDVDGKLKQSGVFAVMNERRIRIGSPSKCCIITLRRPLECSPDDVRTIRLVPIGNPSKRTPLRYRRYAVHVTYETHIPPYSELEDVEIENVLGLDDGIKRNWQFSSGDRYQHIEKRTWGQTANAQSKVRRKKRGSRRKVAAQRRECEYQRIRIAERKRQFNAYAISVLESSAPSAIAIEDKSFKSMSASAKGTAQNPGKNVAQKRGLNRSLRETALSGNLAILKNQAVKRGIYVIPVHAAGSSQTCPRCGDRRKANRESQAAFCCRGCGYQDNADYTASLIIRNRGYASIQRIVGRDMPIREVAPTGWRKQPSRFGQQRLLPEVFNTQAGSHRAETRRAQSRRVRGSAECQPPKSATVRGHPQLF